MRRQQPFRPHSPRRNVASYRSKSCFFPARRSAIAVVSTRRAILFLVGLASQFEACIHPNARKNPTGMHDVLFHKAYLFARLNRFRVNASNSGICGANATPLAEPWQVTCTLSFSLDRRWACGKLPVRRLALPSDLLLGEGLG